MKLRNKILISMSLVWVLFLILTYAGSNAFLIRSFLTLEENRGNRDLGRVDQALMQINSSLHSFTSDWAHWNDLYAFMRGTNPRFIQSNMTMTTYVNSHINLMTFWNSAGKLVLGEAIDTDNKKIVPMPSELKNYFYPGSVLLSLRDAKNYISGFILTGNGIMLVAAETITDGNKVLPPVGTLVNGRYLDQDVVTQLTNTTKTPIKLFILSDIAQSEALTNIFNLLSKEEDHHYNVPVNSKILEGYTLISDVNGKPIGMLQITSPRVIYQSGVGAISYYFSAFFVLAILFSLLLIWLLRVLIVKRLEGLDNELIGISSKNDFHIRVNKSGNDELTTVSSAINNMLDIIQVSQDKLEQRVRERTLDLEKTNVQLQEEIVERKTAERELLIHKEHLMRLAHYDNLTTLPNRVFFNEILDKTIQHAQYNNESFAVLFIDLDRFKTINDALGHPMGDLVIKCIGERFAEVKRGSDVLARTGGDEFNILLTDIHDSELVGVIANKLLTVCTEPVKVDSHAFYVTASIGICIFPKDAKSLEDIHKFADMAMYKAKRLGGNNYQFYTNDMNISANEQIKLEADLRRGIQNNELVLYFQPQLSLSDGKIHHMEALVRWEHPQLGLINPVTFIPLAEETGLIMPIGEWAIKEVCRMNKAWQTAGYDPVSVAVNISPKQFRHQDVIKIVNEALIESKLDPQYLEIEITETAMMEDVEDTINKLNKIHTMGVRISVDDFGTGYTAISYLKQFPISVLKIDQHFIKGIPHRQDDVAITSAVIALGHNLGLKIVAEGVESAEQLQYLTEHHCDLIQGYYFSRPLPESKIITLFTRNGIENV